MHEFEEWADIEHFENYQISSMGRVRRIHPEVKEIHAFMLPDGSWGVKLYARGRQHQQLIRRLVAGAFCEQRDLDWDTSVVHIDGDKDNCRSDNLAWRPRWIAWKYHRQFSTPDKPIWLHPVRNVRTGMEFNTIIEAGLHDVTLWQDVFDSALVGSYAYPGISYEFL